MSSKEIIILADKFNCLQLPTLTSLILIFVCAGTVRNAKKGLIMSTLNSNDIRTTLIPFLDNYFTPFSSFAIVVSEQVNVCLVPMSMTAFWCLYC